MEQVLINIILTASIYLIISQSFVLLYQTTRFFNVAHAAIITLGGYFTFAFYKFFSYNMFSSILMGIFFSVLVAIILELVIYKPLRKKGVNSFLLLIASLGIYIIINNVILIIWGAQTNILRSSNIEAGINIFSAYATNIQVYTVVVIFLMLLFVRLILNYSKLGKQIKAISSNPELANIFGVKSDRIILISLVIGSILAAIVGILVSFDTDLTPNMGFNLLLYGIVAMIIGGVGNIYGLVGGAFLLSMTQHLGAYYFDGKWMDAIAFIILILFLVWKPLGLSGNKLKKTQI